MSADSRGLADIATHRLTGHALPFFIEIVFTQAEPAKTAVADTAGLRTGDALIQTTVEVEVGKVAGLAGSIVQAYFALMHAGLALACVIVHIEPPDAFQAALAGSLEGAVAAVGGTLHACPCFQTVAMDADNAYIYFQALQTF